MKLTGKFKFAWSMKSGSMAVAMILLNSYVSYYATNFMNIPIATVGIVFMVAKIFDGFTDIIAGYVIDHTHTKLGKARPYDLGLIGYWGCTVALFCAPDLGDTAAVIYLFLMYALIQSVFYTMLTCNDPVYLANTGCTSEQTVSLSSFAGVITMFFSLAATILIPQLASHLGTTKEGWRIIAVMLAVPLTLLGLIRFFVIKETTDTAKTTTDDLTMKESLKLLFKNKYIMLFAFILIVANLGSNLTSSVDTYFYRYIYGDIGGASVGAVSVISLIAAIALVPALSKKFGFQRTMRMTTVIGAIGYCIRLFNVHNIVVLGISCFFGSVGFATLFMFINVYIVDCMDYGEWKNGKRSEGIIACAQGVACKLGTAFGIGISGILMGISGFDASLEVQSSSANGMIVALTTIVPAAFCIIVNIALRFYKLDDNKQQMQKELEERHNKQKI